MLLRALIAVLVLTTARVQVAAAGDYAWPATSAVPAALVTCPAGDIAWTVVARSRLGLPCSLSTIVLDWTPCPGFQLSPLTGAEDYVALPAGGPPWLGVRKTTDLEVRCTFAVRGGGTCPAGTVTVYGDGMRLADRALSSPDQNGDQLVNGADLAIANGKVGSADPTADLDGDGVVTAADLGILATHLGHMAAGPPTAARRSGWGAVKLLYR